MGSVPSGGVTNETVTDILGLVGIGSFNVGVYLEFGLGWALIGTGVILLTLVAVAVLRR